MDSSDDSGMEDWMKVVEVGHGGSLLCDMSRSSMRLAGQASRRKVVCHRFELVVVMSHD
jgi:hypothetical protein